jgi:hypothetical protein
MSDNYRKRINKDGPRPTFCCRVDRKTRMPERFANHAIENARKSHYTRPQRAPHMLLGMRMVSFFMETFTN